MTVSGCSAHTRTFSSCTDGDTIGAFGSPGAIDLFVDILTSLMQAVSFSVFLVCGAVAEHESRRALSFWRQFAQETVVLV